MGRLIKDYLKAAKAVFLFEDYTDMPRSLEISYGVLSWIGVGIILYGAL